MKLPLNEENKTDPPSSAEKGGMRTMPFIIVNETFEKVASYGLLSNMIIYLMRNYNMSIAKGASVLFIWSATSNFTPLLGAFLADSYLGRFHVIALGTFISFFGVSLLWSTALIPGARPPECNPQVAACESATPPQLTLLFSSFALMSLGAGGNRPCSLAFGADQLDHPEKQKKAQILQSFFNWYYASVGVSIMLSVTLIVYIQDSKGWKVGFGVPAVLMLISATLFLMGSSFYVKVKADKSLFTGLAQVVAAALKNRSDLTQMGGGYFHRKDSQITSPTDTLRFLNKACLIRNSANDLNTDGSATNPWELCTVEQVEDLKSLIKLIPMWSTGIVIAVTINQHSFQVVQATTMDRHLGPTFQIPPGSFGVFGMLTLTIWVVLYDRVFVPLLRNYTGQPRGLSLKQRMGIGLLLSCGATAISAVVEGIRRRRAIREGFSSNWNSELDMSAMWLVPQHCLAGLAEAFNAIGQIEFYYSELPKTMSSIGVALFTLGMGVGSLMGSVIVGVVDDMSVIGGGHSWVSSNLNKGHYDYYYWVLSVLGAVNFLYFLLCSWAYGPCKEDEVRVWGKEEEIEREENKSIPREEGMLVN